MTQKTLLRISAIVSGISGVIILAGVIYPIISYDAKFSRNFNQYLSPVVQKEDADASVNGAVNEGEIDYTQASNWFPGGASRNDFASTKVEYYSLTVPRLKIDKAVVAIGGEDLSEHIIQYPGTALPGKRGNSVLFGRSILPIFYNPKDYISIFSLLPTLKKGDEILVDYDGISFKYRVESMFEVAPTDIQVLDQDSSDSFLTLVTCTPPGDPRKPKRLIVRARVVPLGEESI